MKNNDSANASPVTTHILKTRDGSCYVLTVDSEIDVVAIAYRTGCSRPVMQSRFSMFGESRYNANSACDEYGIHCPKMDAVCGADRYGYGFTRAEARAAMAHKVRIMRKRGFDPKWS